MDINKHIHHDQKGFKSRFSSDIRQFITLQIMNWNNPDPALAVSIDAESL